MSDTPSEKALATVECREVYRLTLCGSTRFRAEYELWNRRLSMAGFLVYSVSCFGHSGDPLTDEEKEQLDRVHLAKIDASHAVVVINPSGYIGDSTRREIAHAEATGKPVYYLEDGRTVYQLRTGPSGPSSLRYRAFDHAALTASPAAPTDEETGKLVEALTTFADNLGDGINADPAAAVIRSHWPMSGGNKSAWDLFKADLRQAAAHLTTQAEQIARLREELERSTLFGTETHREYVDSEARAEAEIARLTARLGEVTGERDDLDRKLGDCECGYADIGDKYRAAEAKLAALTAPAHDLDALREAVAQVIERRVDQVGYADKAASEILALPAIRNALASQ